MMSGSGFGWFGWLMMLAAWVLFVAGVVWLVRNLRASGDGSRRDGRRILDERFARGELSAEEYEERRRVLR